MPTPVNTSIPTAVAVAALLMVSACYRYTPIDGGSSSVGREVVLELSERGSIDLAPQLGAQLKSVSGRISDFSGDVYQVSVTQTTSRGGVETLWRGENAAVPRAYVTGVGDRQLDKRRTSVAAGLTVLGVALAGRAFGVNGLEGILGGGGRPRGQ